MEGMWHGQITSKPSIHIVTSYTVYEIVRTPQENLSTDEILVDENQYLQDEGIDLFILSYETFVWDLKVPIEFPKFSVKFPSRLGT